MNEIHVKIAEVKTGRSGDTLRALLGSCVGIAFVWKEKDICGLAHCFLPETETEAHLPGGKYVNQAILSLMKVMGIKKENIKEIDVYIAGGGNMMNKLFKINRSQVGQFNAEAAYKYLACHGFKIKGEMMGSNTGSRITVNCTSGEVEFSVLEEINYHELKSS